MFAEVEVGMACLLRLWRLRLVSERIQKGLYVFATETCRTLVPSICIMLRSFFETEFFCRSDLIS